MGFDRFIHGTYEIWSALSERLLVRIDPCIFLQEQLLVSGNMETGAVMFILNFRRPEFCYLFSLLLSFYFLHCKINSQV